MKGSTSRGRVEEIRRSGEEESFFDFGLAFWGFWGILPAKLDRILRLLWSGALQQRDKR
jgi:hypothetical protein